MLLLMSKLLIISHTKHYFFPKGEIMGWEPTIREINHFATIFDMIYHVAPLHTEIPHNATASYSKDNIKYVPIRPTGGRGIIKKILILLNIPFVLLKIIQITNKVDWIFFRSPTNLGVFVLPWLSICWNKKKWVKYAGNWEEENPPISYWFQRWWLNNNLQKSLVTINGKWNDQGQHLLSFENPCITDDELKSAQLIAQQKDYSNKLNICFVGRLEPAKGALIVLELLKNLKDITMIDTFYVVGDGPSKKIFENQKSDMDIKVCLTGWLSRKQLIEIYTKCHLIILPSYASEGFPKVIAEASSYGCLPIVSNQSSIEQYIENNISGFLLKDLSVRNIESIIKKIIKDRNKLIAVSNNASKLGELFTYSRYVNRIETEILDV